MFLLRASIFSTFYFRFRVYSGCYDRCRNFSIRKKKNLSGKDRWKFVYTYKS